jgi:hypothetical protein
VIPLAINKTPEGIFIRPGASISFRFPAYAAL